MTLYLYNYFNGQPANIAGVGTGSIYLRNYTSASGGTQLTSTPNNPVTGGYVSTGVYSASFALYTSESVVHDRWLDTNETICYYTGSYRTKVHKPSQTYSVPKYITHITNLKSAYCPDDNNRFRVFTRKKDWNDAIYTKAVAAVQLNIVDDAYYKIYRVVDDKVIVDFGTGSYNHTRLSYDQSGSYFDFDMSILEKDYEYGIKFTFLLNGIYEEQTEVFTFRVE
jgi:hypothetical protein